MNRKKWYSRFDHHTGFLSVDRCEANLPAELFQHFHGRLGLSLATVRFFGVCLDVGYTESQIIEHFQPDWQVRQGFERLGHRLPNGEAWAPHGYLTLCTEVAYGSHREAERRWPPEAYLQIAERAWQTYGLPTVLLGLEDAPLVSRDMHYLKDCRRLPRLADTAMWLAGSRAYLGNDSGLLHLANLLGVPTVGVYRTTEPHSSGPIQPWLNRPVVRPESIDEVWQAARAVLEVPAGVSAKA
jgi:ADP-heptose:LPS heptosyltransferase